MQKVSESSLKVKNSLSIITTVEKEICFALKKLSTFFLKFISKVDKRLK